MSSPTWWQPLERRVPIPQGAPGLFVDGLFRAGDEEVDRSGLHEGSRLRRKRQRQERPGRLRRRGPVPGLFGRPPGTSGSPAVAGVTSLGAESGAARLAAARAVPPAATVTVPLTADGQAPLAKWPDACSLLTPAQVKAVVPGNYTPKPVSDEGDGIKCQDFLGDLQCVHQSWDYTVRGLVLHADTSSDNNSSPLVSDWLTPVAVLVGSVLQGS